MSFCPFFGLYARAARVYAREGVDPGHDRVKGMKKKTILLFLLLIVGSVIRLSGLAEYPHGIWHDEAQNAIEAGKILHEPGYWPIFVAGRSQMAALPFYFFAPFLALFPDEVYGLRVATVVVGVASIISTWLLADLLFGVEVAFIAAALLAVMRWHITFSQFGMAMIFTSFFIPLISYFFLRAVLQEQLRYAVCAGIAMGIGLQTYYPMITVPLLLLGICFYLGIRRQFSIRKLKLVVVFLIVATACYIPMILYATNNWEAFTARFAAASAASPSAILKAIFDTSPESKQLLDSIGESVMRHLKMFHFQGDANGRHNIPGAPMLDTGTGILFALGFMVLVASISRWQSLFLLLWVLMCLSAGVFSIGFEAPQGARTLGITPAISIISALPLGLLLKISRGRVFIRALLLGISLGIYSWISFENYRQFFLVQRPNPAVWSAFAVEAKRIGEIVRDEAHEAIVYVPEQLSTGSTQEFLAGIDKISRVRVFSRTNVLPLSDEGQKVVIFFYPQDVDTEETIKSYYPHATFEELAHYDLHGKKDVSAIKIARIPAQDIQAVQGWEVYAFREGKEIGRRVVLQPSVDLKSFDQRVDLITMTGLLLVRKQAEITFSVDPAMKQVTKIFGEKIDANKKLLGQGGYIVDVACSPPRGVDVVSLQISANEQLLDSKDLFLAKLFRGGLVGSYFQSADHLGSELFTRLDQQISFYFHFMPLPKKPYSIVWEGSLLIPESGTYEIGTKSKDFSSVYIDSEEVLNNPLLLIYKSSQIPLVAGWHPIRVILTATNDYNQIYLYWKRPSAQEREVIPSEFFWPGKRP